MTMKQFLSLCLCAVLAVPAWAQEFSFPGVASAAQPVVPPADSPCEFAARWIRSARGDEASAQWFHRTYLFDEQPDLGRLHVNSNGPADVFVNGYNVSLAVWTTGPHDYDIGRYLRPDSNTIAVCMQPCDTLRHLALAFWGTLANGQPFAHQADETWLARPAPGHTDGRGGETIDGRRRGEPWKAHTIDLALWTPARAAAPMPPTDEARHGTAAGSPMIAFRRTYDHFDRQGDTITYDFGQGFTGWVRLTLRDTHPGERINIGTLEYRCAGETDEQACRKFTLAPQRRVSVWGDSLFRPEQVWQVEAVEIYPQPTLAPQQPPRPAPQAGARTRSLRQPDASKTN